MATTRQATNSRFQRSSGTYKCSCCGHRTRDTGGGGAFVGSCDLCYDLAGEENSVSDTGELSNNPAYIKGELAKLDQRNGEGTAQRLFPTVCKAAGYIG